LARANGAAAQMRQSIARAKGQLDPQLQLASTSPLQSTTSGLHPAIIHQMVPPVQGSRRPITAYYHLSTCFVCVSFFLIYF